MYDTGRAEYYVLIDAPGGVVKKFPEDVVTPDLKAEKAADSFAKKLRDLLNK